MRASSRLLLLLTLMCSVSQPVRAESRLRSSAADLVDQFWGLLNGVSVRLHSQREPSRHRIPPQAIPQGGTPIDLSDLRRPTAIESQLRAALDQDSGARQLTIPDVPLEERATRVAAPAMVELRAVIVVQAAESADSGQIPTLGGTHVFLSGAFAIPRGGKFRAAGEISRFGGADLGRTVGHHELALLNSEQISQSPFG